MELSFVQRFLCVELMRVVFLNFRYLFNRLIYCHDSFTCDQIQNSNYAIFEVDGHVLPLRTQAEGNWDRVLLEQL